MCSAHLSQLVCMPSRRINRSVLLRDSSGQRAPLNFGARMIEDMAEKEYREAIIRNRDALKRNSGNLGKDNFLMRYKRISRRDWLQTRVIILELIEFSIEIFIEINNKYYQFESVKQIFNRNCKKPDTKILSIIIPNNRVFDAGAG